MVRDRFVGAFSRVGAHGMAIYVAVFRNHVIPWNEDRSKGDEFIEDMFLAVVTIEDGKFLVPYAVSTIGDRDWH